MCHCRIYILRALYKPGGPHSRLKTHHQNLNVSHSNSSELIYTLLFLQQYSQPPAKRTLVIKLISFASARYKLGSISHYFTPSFLLTEHQKIWNVSLLYHLAWNCCSSFLLSSALLFPCSWLHAMLYILSVSQCPSLSVRHRLDCKSNWILLLSH